MPWQHFKAGHCRSSSRRRQVVAKANPRVIVLDENILDSQRGQLRRWRIHFCLIGYDVGRKGMQDEEIIPLLRSMRKPTFVTWDSDYFDRTLCSDHYCLVYLDVPATEVAAYARRLLRHPEFKTWSQRLGRVVRVAASGIFSWRVRAPYLSRHQWIAGR